MGLMDSLRHGADVLGRCYAAYNKMTSSDSTDCLTNEERALLQKFFEKTPEELLAECREEQAAKAEKQRIKALKRQETQYNLGGFRFRRSSNGLFYFGTEFRENAGCWKLVDFQWVGPVYKTITTTSSEIRPKGKLRGAIFGGALAGFGGALLGAANGMERTVDRKTEVQRIEQNTVGFLTFESVVTGERKRYEITCNSKIAAQAMRLLG